MSVFDGLKARFDRLFADAGRGDPRATAAALREALLEAKVGLGTLRDAEAATLRELAAERKHLTDAERRGELARGIADAETEELAARFSAKHRERVELLERKAAVQREEVRLAERDVEEMGARLKPAAGDSGSVQAAWRDIEAAGGTRPDFDLDGALDKARADRAAAESAVEAQLAYLKKKFGKE